MDTAVHLSALSSKNADESGEGANRKEELPMPIPNHIFEVEQQTDSFGLTRYQPLQRIGSGLIQEY